MIKGAKKQMIVLRIGDSRYFDEAYFVMRRDVSEHEAKGEDILGEANRILRESTLHRRHTPKAWRMRWIFFFVGCICGALCAAVTVCLIVF
jgi:hypothetical protein